MKYLIPIVAFSLLPGCYSTSNHFDVKLDPDIPVAEQKNIDSALVEWSRKTGLTFTVTVEQFNDTDYVDGEIHIRWFKDAQGPDWPAGKCGDTEFHTTNKKRAALIRLASDRCQPVARSIALHELGHAFGLLHSPDERSIMFWNTTTQDHVTDDDAKNVLAWDGE